MGITRISLILGYIVTFIWWAGLQFDAHLSQLKVNIFSVAIFTHISASLILIYFQTRAVKLPTKRGLELLLAGLALLNIFWLGNILGLRLGSYLNILLLAISFFFSWAGLFYLSEDNGLLIKSFQLATVFGVIFTLISWVSSDPLAAGFFDAVRFLMIFLPLGLVSLFVISVVILVRKYDEERVISWLALVGLGYAIYLASMITFLQQNLGVLAPTSFPPGLDGFLNLTAIFMLSFGILGILFSKTDLIFGKHVGITYFKDVTYKVPVSLN